MWWFIGLIVLVAIIFGVSLHEAFWGIVAFVAILCAAGWAFGTKSGKKFIKWAAIICGVVTGVIIAYQGIVKKTGDAKLYEDDIRFCQSNYSGYQEDHSTGKLVPKADACIEQATSRSKSRNDWWVWETGAGVMLIIFALAIWLDDRQKQSPKPSTNKSATQRKSSGNRR